MKKCLDKHVNKFLISVYSTAYYLLKVGSIYDCLKLPDLPVSF